MGETMGEQVGSWLTGVLGADMVGVRAVDTVVCPGRVRALTWAPYHMIQRSHLIGWKQCFVLPMK